MAVTQTLFSPAIWHYKIYALYVYAFEAANQMRNFPSLSITHTQKFTSSKLVHLQVILDSAAVTANGTSLTVGAPNIW